MGRVFSSHQNAPIWDLPGSPVVKTLSFQYKGRGFNPWLGNKDPTCCIAKKKKKKKEKKMLPLALKQAQLSRLFLETRASPLARGTMLLGNSVP